MSIDFKAITEQLEQKALNAHEDVLKYDKFNDMSEVLTPNQRGRIDGAIGSVKIALDRLYEVISDVETEVLAEVEES